MKLWMVRATTTVLLWTYVVQFTAIEDTWGRVCLGDGRRASRRPRRRLRSPPARGWRCRSPSSRRTRCLPGGKVAEKAHEVTLHTEDIDHSICAVRSMAEFGLLIAEDMIKDINKSLKIMSKTQPKRGLI